MQKIIPYSAFFRKMRHPANLLVCFSAMSLAAGTLLAVNADSSVFSLMRQVEFQPVSIVVSLASQLLPFLIAAYAAYYSQLWLLHAVCSCKLFLFAYTGTLIWIGYGLAGWLVRFLFLFSDVIFVPFLCWFCFSRLTGERIRKKDFLICLGAAAATAILNCYLLSPFLAKIL